MALRLSESENLRRTVKRDQEPPTSVGSDERASGVRGEDDDEFRVLVASDLHIGYAERDSVRGEDTLKTFEEVLKIAHDKDVDFLLLGGDLFDENVPSPDMLHKVVRLLRQYCMGERAVRVQYLSDAAQDFNHSQFPRVNYEDPNLNIGLPIFSIHGNHDDMSGGELCALDLLHETGLINFFGKHSDCSQLDVTPILLQKGSSRLALYGIGAHKDDRIQRAFAKDKVTFHRPKADPEEWYNLLVLHQTRTDYGRNNKYLSDTYIPDFFDLTVWGHEHKCITPQNGDSKYVLQPGSTVATSLGKDEAGDKFVHMLRIKGKDFNTIKIKLSSVRQFYFGEPIVLAESDLAGVQLSEEQTQKKNRVEEQCISLCERRVEQLVARAKRERRPGQPELPLIRIRVDYSDYEPFSTIRFGQKFVSQVANPKDILLFHKAREMRQNAEVDSDVMDELAARTDALQVHVEDLVKDYFKCLQEKDKTKQMTVLTASGMREAIKDYMLKNDRDAMAKICKHQLGKTRESLKKEIRRDGPLLDEEEIKRKLVETREVRFLDLDASELADQQDARAFLDQGLAFPFPQEGGGEEEEEAEPMQDAILDENDRPEQPSRGKGRGRGGQSQRRPRGRGRGRATSGGRQSQLEESWLSRSPAPVATSTQAKKRPRQTSSDTPPDEFPATNDSFFTQKRRR